jgi:peptidoglycan/xylan/chitin deacetylase (PgdA/CDA1 family)
MNVRAQLGSLRRQVLSSLYSRNVSLGTGGPVVSFTFDDFPRTALTAGGDILKSNGVRGTYYAAIGLMNKSNELGEQFRREDLDLLLRDGHELASHTFGHVSSHSLSCSEFRREVENGRRAIEELTGRSDSGNFAFPFGEVTLNAKRMVGMDVASSRGIWGGLNGPNVDLNLLRAISLYGDCDKYAQVQQLILDNERGKQWLIFYSHDVRENPSRYGCTPALLAFAVSVALQRNSRILTVAEVVAELGACQLEQTPVSTASL